MSVAPLAKPGGAEGVRCMYGYAYYYYYYYYVVVVVVAVW